MICSTEIEDILNLTIEELELGPRAVYGLRKKNINTLRDLLNLTTEQYGDLKYDMGIHAFQKLIRVLEGLIPKEMYQHLKNAL